MNLDANSTKTTVVMHNNADVLITNIPWEDANGLTSGVLYGLFPKDVSPQDLAAAFLQAQAQLTGPQPKE